MLATFCAKRMPQPSASTTIARVFHVHNADTHSHVASGDWGGGRGGGLKPSHQRFEPATEDHVIGTFHGI